MKNNPIAYEWHNLKTGHCYVDYIRHPDLEFDGEYTKTPLYKTEQPSAPVSGEEIMKGYKLFLKEQHPSLNIDWTIKEYLKTNYVPQSQSKPVSKPEPGKSKSTEELLDKLINGQYAEDQTEDYLIRLRILEEAIIQICEEYVNQSQKMPTDEEIAIHLKQIADEIDKRNKELGWENEIDLDQSMDDVIALRRRSRLLKQRTN